MTRPPGRPAGDVSQAIALAAFERGAATVRELAQASCVGFDAARYTVSRMVARDELMAVNASDGALLPPGRHALVKSYVLACRLPLPEEPPRDADVRTVMWVDL